jgi:flagellar basal-body rod modification protein FlgD
MSAAVTGTTGFSLDDLKDRLGLSTTKAAAATSSDTLDQTAFLKLMTTQLKNQDPFKPVENTEMVAQMAQMSATSGIAEMNASLKAISTRLGSSETAAALSYVGKSVLVKGDIGYPGSDGGISAYAEIDQDASGMTVQITDAAGAPVRTITMGAQEAGQVEIDWDGKDNAGANAGAGPFTVKAMAQTAAGTIAASTLVWSPVTSVNLPSDGTSPTLQLAGLGTRPLTDVRQVG